MKIAALIATLLALAACRPNSTEPDDPPPAADTTSHSGGLCAPEGCP